MASTNPLQHAEGSNPIDSGEDRGPVGRRLRTHGRRASRRGKNRAKRELAKAELEQFGLPDWEGLRPVLLFLLFPAMFIGLIAITGGEWDPILMYGIAGLFGVYVALSTLRDTELVFACIVLYIPFSKTFAISIAPMVNGTNMLIALGLFASIIRTSDKRQFWFGWPPGSTLVTVFAVFTMFSAVTLLRLPGGFEYLLYSEFLNYKSWVDQFILFFIAICCIRDVKTAKRVWVYMILGSILIVLYTIPEFFDKSGRSTIEKSRLDGPHQQSNNFGGFVAYSSLPLVAMFVVYIRDIRAWLVTPYFLVMLKILITTFSRGAYLAFAAGALFSGYLKSGRFLLFWALFAISFFAIFPQVLPDAVLARLGAVTEEQTSSAAPEQLDRSSEIRLIMWRAAARMILENPILGKGFKAFPKLKADYTEQWVKESDPHSMYLYLGSQMGLPSVILFLFILLFSVFMGFRLARSRIDRFSRAIGVGGASAAVCYAIVCVFGSRAVNADFTAYFWFYFVVMAVLYRDLVKKANPDTLGMPSSGSKRTNAFEAQAQQRKTEHELANKTPAAETMRGRKRRPVQPDAEPDAGLHSYRRIITVSGHYLVSQSTVVIAKPQSGLRKV